MASVIRKLVKDMFGIPDRKVLFLGLDASGRTTALYQLKMGEVVMTVPTIGFNVETITHRGIDYTIWDVGGCDKIRPLWRHYFGSTDVMVFFVDSADEERLDAARDELHMLLNEETLEDVILCVAANKQDLPSALDLDVLTDRLGLHGLPDNRTWHMVGISATEKVGLWEMFDWMDGALRSKDVESQSNEQEKRKGKGSATKQTPEDTIASKVEETLVDWLERTDEDDDEFLGKLADYTLESWDHRTHLRIAWLLLQRHGRQKGMPEIFDGIRNFIANSTRTHRSQGTTFHETMTYFWTHMVHYAMETSSQAVGDGFRTFLLLNPQLANGGLFLHYYSKKLMLQTASSRTEVALPDLRPLPSLITDVSKPSSHSNISETVIPRAAPLSDDEFLLRWEEGILTAWGHETRLRAIWLCLQRDGRKEGVKRAFAGLEATEKSGYHVTVAYFWIQMTDYSIRKDASNAPTFGLFIQRPTSQALRNPDLIFKCYSQAALDRGKSEFALPNIKPLPSLV